MVHAASGEAQKALLLNVEGGLCRVWSEHAFLRRQSEALFLMSLLVFDDLV